MKVLLGFSTIVMISALWTTQSQAQTTYTSYDRFDFSYVRPTRWAASGSKGTSSPLDERRSATDGGLKMESLSWSSSSTSLDIKVPVLVTAIRAKVSLATSTTATACTAGTPLERASIGGRFFKDVGSGLDVAAFADLQIGSDGLPAANYRVQWCDDSECTSGAILASGATGTLAEGAFGKISVEWDGVNNQFLFQLDTQPLVSVPYTLDDSSGGPLLNKKGLQIAHLMPTCSPGETATSRIKTFVDDVEVNAEAAPAP